MTATISDRFIDVLHAISKSKIPANVLEQAELCILDYEGCAIAGSKLLHEKELQFLHNAAKQGGNISVFGFDIKTTLHNASLINAMSVHSTELDDGHRLGMIHLGASILSALLPVAELEKLPKTDVLLGSIVGYEAAIRLAISMQPSHKLKGYHTSGTCGTIGAAMAIAAALHFNKTQMKSALSAACASASGLLEMQEDESELKPYNLAHAAQAGISAAYCGWAGFVGPEDPLCGKRGLVTVMSDNPNINYLVAETDYYEIERIYRKPYAACRHCHPAIEAALKIKLDNNIAISDIKSIEIQTYKLAVGGHNHKDIKGIASAKLSLPFSVALALVNGSAGVKDFSKESIADSEIIRLMDKIKIEVNDILSSWSPQKRAAIVFISTFGGTLYNCEIDYPKGEPENPMNREEIINKFN